jgi:hypothetical protein
VNKIFREWLMPLYLQVSDEFMYLIFTFIMTHDHLTYVPCRLEEDGLLGRTNQHHSRQYPRERWARIVFRGQRMTVLEADFALMLFDDESKPDEKKRRLLPAFRKCVFCAILRTDIRR